MRHELKYMVNQLEYKVLAKRLEKILKRDSNSSDEGYTITSLYFDDQFNNAYRQKVEGEAVRHKYRIRYYNDDLSLIKLERKSKVNQMTMKCSVPLSVEEVEMIYSGEVEFLLSKEESLYREFYCEIKHKLLKPKVIVKYERDAFTHPVGDMRVTFDRNVKTANMETNIFNEDISFVPVLEPNQVIVEIKFNGVISEHIQSIIQMGHVTQASTSKYVLSRKYNIDF